MEDLILALDQGTSSSRAILFNKEGRALFVDQQEFTQFTPRPSWVEHDAEEIWTSQLAVARSVVDRVNTSSIAAVGISNQRETTILWERKTGKPIGRAIVWQCRRSLGICQSLRLAGHEELIRARTGLVLDPYFSATKIRWMLDQNEQWEQQAADGEILFGTVDSWLLWKLTDGRVHATDTSNASRTMLMNLQTGAWDDEILDILRIPRAMLPEIQPSVGLFGDIDAQHFGRSIPICGMAGDQHAALFGHRAFNAGEVKNTYGTGCFMLMNVGGTPLPSPGGLLSTVAWSMDNTITYALEGSVFMAGAVLQWLRDDLNLIENVQEVDRAAEEVDDSRGMYLVPAFQGLGTPWWSGEVQGALFGLTRSAKKAHFCRAFLESIAYRSRDVIDVMTADSNVSPGRLLVDGGASRSDVLMQFQANILNIPLMRPAMMEVTALGAALMAGLGAGLWGGMDDLLQLPRDEMLFEPAMPPELREELYGGWLKAVRTLLGRM